MAATKTAFIGLSCQWSTVHRAFVSARSHQTSLTHHRPSNAIANLPHNRRYPLDAFPKIAPLATCLYLQWRTLVAKWLPQRGRPCVMLRQKKQCLDSKSGLAVFCFAMRFVYREPCGRHSVLLAVGKEIYQFLTQNYICQEREFHALLGQLLSLDFIKLWFIFKSYWQTFLAAV